MLILQALIGTPYKNHGPRPALVIAVAFTDVAPEPYGPLQAKD
jgi:hypothetical protein